MISNSETLKTLSKQGKIIVGIHDVTEVKKL